MTGFCETCGRPLDVGGCPNGHTAIAVRRTNSFSVPKPRTFPRLLSSGVEFVAYVGGAWFITGLDFFTAGVVGLFCLPLAMLVGLRDVNAGAFNLAKRISNMRIVDYRTGHSASNLQTFLRNSYYCGFLVIAALPWVDLATSPLFTLLVTVDVIMIVANPKGRRLGDFLAGTQVVAARS